MAEPRGIKNNNPGNLRLSSEKWQGEVTGSDKAFKTFSDPVYGIRAIAKLLLNYERKYGLNTISGLISRWAPPNENDTTAYVKAVAGACGIGAYDPIDVAAYLPCIVQAIIKHENGKQPYSIDLIERGIDLALWGADASKSQELPATSSQPPSSVLPASRHGDANQKGVDVGGTVGAGLLSVAGVTLSKKLCVAILGLLAVLLNKPLALGLSDADVADLVKLLSSYLVGQSAVDAFKPVFLSLLGRKS